MGSKSSWDDDTRELLLEFFIFCLITPDSAKAYEAGCLIVTASLKFIKLIFAVRKKYGFKKFCQKMGSKSSWDHDTNFKMQLGGGITVRRVKRHSIHGMMEEENTVKPHQEIQQLSIDEKRFLLGIERGDIAGTRRLLQQAQETNQFNVNCVDPLGRSAILMAIDNENLEMVELLINYNVDTRDALLHAISEEFVEAVEVLLDHNDSKLLVEGLNTWIEGNEETSTFTPDITPLMLAAHRDNYEIIKILLDRGSILPMPHDVRCGCDECVYFRHEDSLRHSRSRINAYRALASPSLIALSSKDPILTAFELSWELRRLSHLEYEFKNEYQELRKKCQEFATALLDHTRSSTELEVLLNHDPSLPWHEQGQRMQLNRLKLAIKLRQKKFVAHPNVQQLLSSIWYDGLPGFRRKNMVLQALEIIRIVLLMLASQRIETFVGGEFWYPAILIQEDIPTKRGAKPTLIEWMILAWVSGLIWSEIKQLWSVGLQEYVNDMWNVIDFITNSLYVATVALRVVSFIQVRAEMTAKKDAADLPREKWDSWDPMLISEGLFSTANIFSSLKLVYIFSVNPYLGPLQVSLSRMIMDIIKFFFLYVLVLFAFSSGLNQLLWYYADMEKKRCADISPNFPTNKTVDPNACIVWRRFANLFETIQTLFWAVFGLIDLDSFELDGIKVFTRFWGLLMFGTYSVINIVVLLNLLIAMMNHSYQLISERADTEWKFARSKLWISYFEEGGTCPPPFNIIPSPKSMWYVCISLRRLFKCSTASIEFPKTMQKNTFDSRTRVTKYQEIIKNLVRRYVTVEQRNAESQGVTEDDVNEIKQDISAFRCELMEILKNSGMDTKVSASQGAAGKKNRQKERRLMKGFNISTPNSNCSLSAVSSLVNSCDGLETEHPTCLSPFANTTQTSTLHKTLRQTNSGISPMRWKSPLYSQVSSSIDQQCDPKIQNKRLTMNRKFKLASHTLETFGNVESLGGRPASIETAISVSTSSEISKKGAGLSTMATLKQKRKTFSSTKNAFQMIDLMKSEARN